MARAGLAANARGRGANVVPGTREDCAEPRGEGRGRVGASGLVSASQAAERVGSVARDEVPQIKLRKQDVTQELVPCGFSLWPVTFQAL